MTRLVRVEALATMWHNCEAEELNEVEPHGGAYVRLHFRTFQEDRLWVAECVELGVSTSATTQEEATRGILDATNLYIETLADEGELQRVFKERGIQIATDDTPAVGQMEERTLSVPVGAA